MKRLVSSALLGAIIALAAPPRVAAQDAITLQEAIRRAEQVQPRVVQAEGAVHSADARVRSAWGSYLPSLTFSSSGTRSGADAGTGRVEGGQVISGQTATSVSSGLNASVDLFTGFRRGAESNAARARSDAADASLVDARFQQALITTNQFFDALAAQQLVRVREASVRRAEEQLNVSVAKLRAGSATRSDSLRSLVTLGNARLALIQAGSDLTSAEANLARLVGASGRVRAADDSAYYQMVAVLDTQALRQEALEQSPQVRSAAADAEAADASVRAARAGYWPTLTLSGGVSWNGSRSETLEPGQTELDPLVLRNRRQLSLGLSWNLFNRFQREEQIAVQVSSAELAEATAAEARRLVEAELTSQLAELDAARSRIEITLTSVAAATEDLRVQQERYRLGASTIVDVLTSQDALNQAEVDVVNARFDYLRARAQLEALIGRDL